jgi:flagellar hook-basal body complex protein FliE
MTINSIGSIIPEITSFQKTEKPDGGKFNNVLSEFISDVNKSQNHASGMVKDFADGKEVEIHDVMIAGEKAKTDLQLLMEIRNKSVDMYKELLRMQA